MKNLFSRYIVLFILISLSIDILAQKARDSASAFPFIRFQYSYLLPSGDIETTFGNSNAVGGALGYKTKTNWQFELEGSFLFGADVKQKNLLDDIVNDEGDVTDSEGELVRVILDMRAFSFYASVGKVIPVFSSNSNSGILVQVGVGYIQHQIKVDWRDGDVFQFNDEMLKGYDRLHTGLAIRQFIGFQYFGRKNLANFYLGFELNQGFTKNRRGYNYDTRSFDTDSKIDGLTGLRFGWAIPIRNRSSEEYYFY